MNKTKVISLISLIILVSCSNSQQKKVSFRDIEDTKSTLVGKLLASKDFNSNWKISYEEVTQKSGQKDNFHNTDYANYWVRAKYIPLNISYTISQSLYKYDYGSMDDLNKFLFFDNNQFDDIRVVKINGSPEIIAKCGAYQELNEQDCLYTLSISDIVTVLRVNAPKQQSRDELSQLVLPMIKIMELKLQSQ